MIPEILKELANWDFFFFYGKSDLDLECQFDLMQLLVQKKRSLYYNRQESAGLDQYENNPNGIELQIMARYEIANAVAYRNTLVTNGSKETKDRRIAVSQNSIGFRSEEDRLDINILYFLYADYETPRSNSFPLVR